MPSPWLYRLAQIALALVLLVPSVILTAPESLAHTTSESAPNEDQDDGREVELAAPTGRQALNTERPTPDCNSPARSAPVHGARSVRDDVSTRHTSVAALCARLRC